MPRHFANTMRSPYFQIEERQNPVKCKCISCKIENLFKRWFNPKRKEK
jgi:hypothetical protein